MSTLSNNEECIWKNLDIKFKYIQIIRICYTSWSWKFWIEDRSDDQRNCHHITSTFNIKRYLKTWKSMSWVEKQITWQINQTILQQNQNDFIVYNKQNAATLWIYNWDFEKRIKLKLAKNSVTQNIIKNIADNVNFEIINEILTFQDLIYVSTRCRQKIISDYHELMIHEHQSLNKISERISRIYYFFKMRKQIENIIRKCDVCIWTKHSWHRLYELLKSFSTSDHAWKSIALNFIVKLSKSKERITRTMYNFILMITDRLIKYKYFLSYKKATFAKDLTYMFLRMIVANHELSDEIISNKDKLFTLKF